MAVDEVQLLVRMVLMMWPLALLWQLHPLLLKMGSLLLEQEHQPLELFVELGLVAWPFVVVYIVMVRVIQLVLVCDVLEWLLRLMMMDDVLSAMLSLVRCFVLELLQEVVLGQ